VSEAPTDSELSPEQIRSLVCVLDEIVPPSADGRLPGAGELGLVAHLERKLRETPDLRPAVLAGLGVLVRLCRERGASEIAALPRAARAELLNALAAAEPAFLPGLIFQTYVAYYQEGRVLQGLGLEPRPPHPKGYPMEPLDPSLLDPVRLRPKMYREP